MIIPLEGLKRENDIILKVQSYLSEQYGYNFKVAKSLPYVNPVLAKLSKKWSKYLFYQHKKHIKVNGQDVMVYPWFLLPTSNVWINYWLIPFNYLMCKYKLFKELDEYVGDIDLIIAQNTIPDSILAYWLSKRYSVPFIVNERQQENLVDLQKKIPLLKQVFKKAKRILTPNPSISKRLIKGRKVELIPHPVESYFFDYKDERSSDGVPEFITVARLLDWKNIDMVIMALSRMKKEGFNFIYNIAGDGPERDKLQELIQKEGLQNNVSLVGFLSHDELLSYYRKANVFILPSYPETFGRAFIEAAASGCLIVGHKKTGVEGLFTHNESAIFVDKDTIVNELRDFFASFQKGSFLYMVNNSKKIAESMTWEKIGKLYHNIFTEAVTE